MKKTRITRFFSLLLCCLMLVGILPMGQVAYAADVPSLSATVGKNHADKPMYTASVIAPSEAPSAESFFDEQIAQKAAAPIKEKAAGAPTRAGETYVLNMVAADGDGYFSRSGIFYPNLGPTLRTIWWAPEPERDKYELFFSHFFTNQEMTRALDTDPVDGEYYYFYVEIRNAIENDHSIDFSRTDYNINLGMFDLQLVSKDLFVDSGCDGVRLCYGARKMRAVLRGVTANSDGYYHDDSGTYWPALQSDISTVWDGSLTKGDYNTHISYFTTGSGGYNSLKTEPVEGHTYTFSILISNTYAFNHDLDFSMLSPSDITVHIDGFEVSYWYHVVDRSTSWDSYDYVRIFFTAKKMPQQAAVLKGITGVGTGYEENNTYNFYEPVFPDGLNAIWEGRTPEYKIQVFAFRYNEDDYYGSYTYAEPVVGKTYFFQIGLWDKEYVAPYVDFSQVDASRVNVTINGFAVEYLYTIVDSERQAYMHFKATYRGGNDPIQLHTVSFDANGHGLAPAVQTVEHGNTVTKPDDPFTSGWTFGGWYREAACINAFDFSTPITGNITLYAKWTEGNPVLSGTVRIAGGAKHYGDLLELEYTGDIASVPSSKLRFEWQESDNKTTWTNIIGETGATYQTPATGDTMIYVRVRVTADGYDGAVYSDMRAINPPHVVDTLKGTVTIVQDHASEAYFVIGMPITATAKNDAGVEMTMDGLMYRWQKRANNDGAPWEYIPGATGKTYTPVGADENCYIRAEVSYTQLLGELYSSSKWVDWIDESYTVAFNANGHGTAPAAQTVHRGYHVTRPDDPTADGWTFGGWFTEAACTNAFDFEEPVMGSLTLYADWTEDGVFVMTGAEVSANVSKNAGNYILDDQAAVFTWKNGNAPDASAVDYSSSHIYKDAALTDKLLEEPVSGGVYYAEFVIENSVRDDRSIDFSSLTTANCNFTIPGYTVTCENADANVNSMGYSRALLLLKLVKEPTFAFTTQPASGTSKKTESYDFSWATNETPDKIWVCVWAHNQWERVGALLPTDGTSGSISYDDVSYAVKENVTKHKIFVQKGSNYFNSDEFTVTWTDEAVTTYTVTFDANGHGTAPAAQNVESGKTATKPADPTETGWTFGGWYTEAACTNAFDFSTPITGAITLYAKWTKNGGETPTHYTVTFDANGHGTAPAAQNVESGKTATKPADPSETGWTFGGWYQDKTCNVAFDFSTPITGAITLYAKWTKNGGETPTYYTVTFDANGHGTAPSAQSVEDGKTATKPTDPTASGWIFRGWYREAACTNAFDFSTPITGAITLYAKWTKNGGSGGGGYTYYTIKATAGVNGAISPSGSVSVRSGKDQTFTITPDKGYAISDVKIDGKSVGAVKSYTFENVKGNHTIKAIFMKANGNPQTGVFVDVPEGSYYEEAVAWAVENGITKGTSDTTFDPNGICTRAQAVTFLWRAAGSPEPKSNVMPFEDVAAEAYYYKAVLWAVENGITKGTSATTFSPDADCTRAQIVTFLWRSQKSPAADSVNPFTDVAADAYYVDAVLWAVEEKVTKGTSETTFSPDADCTRAQIVTFLYRALNEQ